MRKVGYLFFFFAMTLILAIPISLQGTKKAFADARANEQPEPILSKGKTSFANNHESQEFKSDWNSKVRLELWYDIQLYQDEEKYSMWIKLQKKNAQGEWVDTGQEYKRAPHDADEKHPKDVVFNIQKDTTYRIFFDGPHWQMSPVRNRVSYKLYNRYPIPDQYELKPYYDYNRGENDNLQFSIVNKSNNNDVNFNGKVRYKIIRDDGQEVSSDLIDVTSRDHNRKIKIDQFTDDLLPAETNQDDPVSRTIVKISYAGTVDTLNPNEDKYYLTKEFEIERFKRNIEDITANQEGSNLKVSADTRYGGADRKWEFKLTDNKDNELETKHPKDQGQKSEASFTHEDFNNKKSGIVRVTYTAKKYSAPNSNIPFRISLYRVTGTKRVNAPPAPAPPPSDNGGNHNGGNHNGGNDGGNQDKGNDDTPKEEPVNKEAKIDIDSKILKDENQVEITAKLKKVDQPKGDWTLTFNAGEDGEKKETFKDSQKSTVTQKFSIKDLDKDKVKVIAKFKGNDKNGKIDVEEEKNVKIKDSNENPSEVNEEAKIKLTSKLLENQQVEISAVLENAEEPTGEWTMIFPYNKEEQQTNNENDENQSGENQSNENQNDENKRTSNQATITETFDIKDITDNEALVYVEFKGKDKQNNMIETKLEETITLRNETTPPPSENEDDTDQTQPNEESQADEDEVVEEVITPPESPNDPNGQIGGELPKTATNYPTGLFIGMVLLLGGGIALYLRRRTS